MRKKSSANKVLGILDLFTEESPTWTVEMLIKELNLTRATTYRYVKALYDAGFIVPGAGSSYVLGPRFIQIDRQIMRSDPLLRAARPLLDADRSKLIGAKILSGFYGDRVLSVHVEKIDKDITLTMERGLSFPLIYGSPSQVILAYLPAYQLRNVYNANAKKIAGQRLGDNWQEFRAEMKKIRKAGHRVGGHYQGSVIGVAAPIFHAPKAVSTSLCYVRSREICTEADIKNLVDLVTDTAAKISQELLSYKTEDGSMSPVFPSPRLTGQQFFDDDDEKTVTTVT
ncbi:MAG: helix-turn-helix domain-containing protein [Marinosulfonomonas sp.]|nr:helix-turn-helix domain-containing protein [Marinosulfonomonas sp.]